LGVIRRSVPPLDADRPLGTDIEAVAEMITEGLLKAL
jgi:histidine ammonia-lyase